MIDVDNQRKAYHQANSAWVRSFSLQPVKCLIVCRGPIRKEAIDIFRAIGIRETGILLSEKDSIVYPNALAPEIRDFIYHQNIHRVPDYIGFGQQEKMARIEQIINIALEHGYSHIFAGYGFMAEDAEFIEQIEKHSLHFMGPASSVSKKAGSKDEAKKLARSLNVSVTPGIDNITSLALLEQVTDHSGLQALADKHNLAFVVQDERSLIENCECLLSLAYEKIVELVSIEQLQSQASKEIIKIWQSHGAHRIRLKHIGGGGGKGQRIIQSESEIASAVYEVLAEAKALTPGSNRNFLIELNIENTRHNEIQLLGNGQWCVSLGGRDCSLQMHEQKLLELSITQEMLQQQIQLAKNQSQNVKSEVLQADLLCLQDMEQQAERFGLAVGLDSASTFELIVTGTDHFFMEVNTRIQVEHRVTEMVYQLKFCNADNPRDFFIVDSLLEAMALLSLHGSRLPRPQRILRNISGGEVRINATNEALQPHAGGIISHWSPPLDYEIRDDQGIGTRNPDTGLFVHYKVAGAYDSNIALVICSGQSRQDNIERLDEILRRAELRGPDLKTNLEVHYGLINWILSKDAMFKPNTQFMSNYLAAIGSLQQIVKDVNLDLAWKHFNNQASLAEQAILQQKSTLIMRPLIKLLSNAHLLAGFIGQSMNKYWRWNQGPISFIENPVNILSELYHYLNLDKNDLDSPSEQIWEYDYAILSEALSYYDDLSQRLKQKLDYPALDALHQGSSPLPSLDSQLWQQCCGAHHAFQLGMKMLLLIPSIGRQSGFSDLDVDDRLEAIIPERFKDTQQKQALIKNLQPTMAANSDEIATPMGGMFYSREAPDREPFVVEGDRFEAGQPLFVIEVMKMFNKISVPFSGRIVKNIMLEGDGKVVAKGQVIFKIQPDETMVAQTPEEILQRQQTVTLGLLASG